MRSHKGSFLQKGADRTGDATLTNKVFHAMHVIPSLKLGHHKSLTLFLYGRLLKRTLLVVLPAILIQMSICAFPSLVPVCGRGQSGTAWCYPASAGGMPVPKALNSGKLSIDFVHFVLFLIFSIILVLSVFLVKLILYSICKYLSLFLLFPSSGGRAVVNREHL